MKYPVKLVVVRTLVLLLAVGLTAGTAFAATSLDSSGESHRISRPLGDDYHRGIRGIVQGVAEALGLEVSEVVAQLRASNTLAQIIEDNGSTAEEVVDAVLEDIRARLLERLSASP